VIFKTELSAKNYQQVLFKVQDVVFICLRIKSNKELTCVYDNDLSAVLRIVNVQMDRATTPVLGGAEENHEYKQPSGCHHFCWH